MRIPTGVPGFDKIIGGGLPEASVTLLYGPPGSGKSTFTLNLISNALDKKKKVIFINTYEPASAVRKKMKLYNFTVNDNLIFINAYPFLKCEEKYFITNLSNLNELNLQIKKAVEDTKFKKGLFVIDSVSDFLLYNDEKEVYKFLQITRGKIIALDSVGLFVLEEGMHKENQFSTINYLTDATIRMEISKAKRYLKIERMHNTKHPLEWIEFNIAPDAKITVREFFK